jgi:peptide-methionine (S)-S-oxide reductase
MNSPQGRPRSLWGVLALVLVGCGAEVGAQGATFAGGGLSEGEPAPPTQPVLDTAWFAGGCFWCMEPPFDEVEGVRSTTSGFMGGRVANPTYSQVTAGGTGHAEVVQVVFEPARVSYETLLRIFWVNVDPVDGGGQFCDRGEIYRSEIFVKNAAQRTSAQTSLEALRRSGRFRQPIATRITAASPFYEAEAYHQDFYRKNPIRYRTYRSGCGRDRRLRELWGANPLADFPG